MKKYLPLFSSFEHQSKGRLKIHNFRSRVVVISNRYVTYQIIIVTGLFIPTMLSLAICFFCFFCPVVYPLMIRLLSYRRHKIPCNLFHRKLQHLPRCALKTESLKYTNVHKVGSFLGKQSDSETSKYFNFSEN